MTDDSSSRFSSATMEMLLDAGWRPGRDVLNMLQLPDGFQLFPAAARILAEFGNLKIGRRGRGQEVAQRTVEIKPMLALCENDALAEVEAVIHSVLYPLGEINEGQAFLAIDDQERTFIVGDLLLYAGTPFDVALERLLLGNRARPVDEQGHW